jgi:hypothetical protein
MRTSFVVLALALLAGCSTSSDPYSLYDAGTDVPSDLIDAATDPGWDPGWDPATDPGWDPGSDPATDPAWDPGTDPGTDPAYDPGFDPGHDPGADPGGGGVVGDACYSATQCGGVPSSSRMCLTTVMGYVTFPGGYCSASCTSSMDCGTGGSCVNFMGYGSYCLKNCTTPYDCRVVEGYDCTTISTATGTYCLPPISGPEGVDP